MPGNKRTLWWIVGGVVIALLAVGIGVAVSRNGSGHTAETPVATTESPSPTPSLSATVEPSTSETPSPLASRTSVKSKSPYCQAYQTILDTAPTTESSDEEGSADLKKLSATYAALITKYSAAAELAPASLKDDYAKVIRYLKDFKITVDSGDWNAVRAQLAVLFKINDAMDSIQKQSDKICN